MNKNVLEAIQCLIGLAKLGSMGLAAKELNLEHKTLKNKLLFLEKQVDKKLINSSTLGTSLTEEGWLLYQRLSSDFNNLSRKFEAYANNENDTKNGNLLNILLPPVTTLFFSIHILPELYKEHPELTVLLTTLNINYILSYGSHIKNMINSFNMLYLDRTALNLINQDEWLLALHHGEESRLFSSKEYLTQNSINNFEDIQNATLIGRLGSKEEQGHIKFKNSTSNKETEVKFNNVITAENDLVKCHLTDQGVGISLLSSTILKCHQNVDLIEIFPEYTHNQMEYSLIYKQSDVDQKYINSIIRLSKKVIDQKLTS